MGKKIDYNTSDSDLRESYLHGSFGERDEAKWEIERRLHNTEYDDVDDYAHEITPYYEEVDDNDGGSSIGFLLLLGIICTAFILLLAVTIFTIEAVGATVFYIDQYKWWAYVAFLFVAIWTISTKERNRFLSILLFLAAIPVSVELFAFIFNLYIGEDYITWGSRPETDFIALLKGTFSFFAFMLFVPLIMWFIVKSIANIVNPKEYIQKEDTKDA
ncbi:hypothetical protein SFC65_19510 [Priestia filamentosa]|uniref:hypothetical protein n=1 Tax=Priestia filamentosa TaxID=1402861 RepID=UPI0039825422